MGTPPSTTTLSALSGKDDVEQDEDDVAHSIMELEWPGEEKKKRCDAYTVAKSGVVVSVSLDCCEKGDESKLDDED